MEDVEGSMEGGRGAWREGGEESGGSEGRAEEGGEDRPGTQEAICRQNRFQTRVPQLPILFCPLHHLASGWP